MALNCSVIVRNVPSKSQLAFFLTVIRFPVEDYKPLQDPPSSDVAKSMELTSCLERLLPAVSFVLELS